MKIDWKSREVKIALTVFVTAAALIMFYRMVEDIDNLLGAVCAGVVQVFDILLPFLMGALIAYILLPLVRWVNKKLYARFIKRDGVRWAVSVGTIFLLVVAAVAGLFAYLVPVLVSNIQEFAANFSDYLEKGQDLIERLMTENVVFSQPAVREGIDNALEDANEYIRNSGKEIAQTALITLKAVGTALTDTVVAIMTGLYLLIDNERLKTSAKRLTNSLFKPERAEKIFGFVHDSDRIFGQYVRARLFESLVVFVAMLIGYTVVPVPYAVLFSIVGAVTNLVPFFGPIAGFLIVVPLVLLIRPERALRRGVHHRAPAVRRLCARPQGDGRRREPAPALDPDGGHGGRRALRRARHGAGRARGRADRHAAFALYRKARRPQARAGEKALSAQ